MFIGFVEGAWWSRPADASDAQTEDESGAAAKIVRDLKTSVCGKARGDTLSDDEVALLASTIRVALGDRIEPHLLSCPCRRRYMVEGGYSRLQGPRRGQGVHGERGGHRHKQAQ
jgi:hypothetical protein